jgi:hypothetical protein
MGAIAGWFIARGLDQLTTAAGATLGVTDPTAAREYAERLEAKLDVLIQAPFRQALMFLRERDLDSCRKKLIEAISLDELNLPALVLYATLLLKHGDIELSLQYLEEVFDRFGTHPILPSWFLAGCKEYLGAHDPLQDVRDVDHFHEMLYPVEICASAGALVTLWEASPPAGKFARLIHFAGTNLVIYNWNSGEVRREEAADITLLGITNAYAAFSINRRLRVCRLKDGSYVPAVLTSEQASKLFGHTNASSRWLRRAFPPGPTVEDQTITIRTVKRRARQVKEGVGTYGRTARVPFDVDLGTVEIRGRHVLLD